MGLIMLFVLMPNFLVRTLHKMGLVKGVALEDHWGKIYYSIKKRHPLKEGVWYAHVYPGSKVGFVILKDDGTCEGSSSYIDS